MGEVGRGTRDCHHARLPAVGRRSAAARRNYAAALPHGVTKRRNCARVWHRLRSLFCGRVGAVGSFTRRWVGFARTRRDSDYMAWANLYSKFGYGLRSLPRKATVGGQAAVLENTLTCLVAPRHDLFC